MIERWTSIRRELRGDFEVFRVHRDVRRSPRTGEEHAFHLIESADWVNILPITPDGRFVMIEQFRHGSDEVTLEIPGGLVDASDEGPSEAARREMIEETGFDSADVQLLGSISPNPAIQTNRCFSYVAYDVREIRPQVLDGAEDILVRLIDPHEVPGLVARGRIDHALVLTALYLFEQRVVTARRAW